MSTFNANWSIRPNPEGQIIRKPEGRIFDRKTELIENRKAQFNNKSKYIVIEIPTQSIKAYKRQVIYVNPLTIF